MAETLIWSGTGDDDDASLWRLEAGAPLDEMVEVRQAGADDTVRLVDPGEVRSFAAALVAWADEKDRRVAAPPPRVVAAARQLVERVTEKGTLDAVDALDARHDDPLVVEAWSELCAAVEQADQA